jgi:hypothetical protein
MPFAANALAFGVIVVLGVGELALVVGVRLS